VTRTRRPAALALALLLGALLPLSPALATERPAQAATGAASHLPAAQDTPADIRIVIDQLTPAIPGPDDTVRITGRVISTSRQTLSDVSVQLRRSSAPLLTRREADQAFAAGMSPSGGDPDALPLYSTRTPVAASLPPGGRRNFSLRLPVSELGLGPAGTYVLGIEALGREVGVDEFDTRKGTLRTFLPWYPPGSTVTPIQLVWLWPLADFPARSADGVLMDNRTPVELSAGGRLDQLLKVGDRFRDTVSWLADPALLQTANAMTNGYQVLQQGSVVLGDREQEARRWLTGLADATQGSPMRGLPYADVDASAVTRAGMSNDVVRAVTQGPGIAAAALGRTVPGDLYWAPFGRMDRPALDVLASAGVTTLILSADAMPATDAALLTDGMATAALPTAVGTIQAVLTDPSLTRTLALPQRSASDVISARQLFLAQTALIAQALPADQTARAVVVAPESVRWAATASLLSPLLKATRTAPWLSSLSLQRLLAGPPSSTSRQRSGYGPKSKQAELDPAYMARVARVSERLDVFTSIIDDPTGISEPYSEALLRAESSAWRSEPLGGERLLSSISQQLEDDTARVRVLSVGTITFSGDTGRVPVTITNELDRSVTVGLDLRGRPPLRLISEPLTGIRIEAGKMASVDIDARVIGGDPLSVDVQLLGPEGASYGRPATITVTATAYARAAAWVVAAAFLAILVFVVVGVTRRIRKAQASRGAADLGR
jgi:hypothetical protein